MRGNRSAPKKPQRSNQNRPLTISSPTTFAIGPHFIRPKPVGQDLGRGQLIGPRDLVSRLDPWVIQNGSYRVLGAIFPNGEIHHGGLEGHSHSLHPDKPALLSQFFCHPANMYLRAGWLGGPLVRLGWLVLPAFCLWTFNKVEYGNVSAFYPRL
jgi:hypothetical protein